jgi:hypothetical protein
VTGGKSSRDKGARYERKVAGFLRDRLGIHAERRLDQWRDSGDDIDHDFEGWLSIEAKDVAANSLGVWVDQAIRSAGPRLGVVFHHRRGNGDPARDFVTMSGEDFVALVEGISFLALEAGDVVLPIVFRVER